MTRINYKWLIKCYYYIKVEKACINVKCTSITKLSID